MTYPLPAPQTPFVLRRLQEADIPHVMTIERQVFPLSWSPGIFRYELRHNRFGYYLAIATTDERLPPLVGYGGIWLYLPEAHISTLAVHPQFQGLHLGAWLLAALLLHAARRGATEATLEVRVSNVGAQRLYTSFGFVVVGRRHRYYSDNGEDAYIMTLAPLELATIRQRFQREVRMVQERWHQRGKRLLAQRSEEPTP